MNEAAAKRKGLLSDSEIVSLFLSRDEAALSHTQAKFGRYLMKVAMMILHSERDSEESVNDTYLRAWNSIPPHEPSVLSTFLGKITRNLSIDRLRKNRAARRTSESGAYDACLEDLSEIASGESHLEEAEEALLAKELGEKISGFLLERSEEERKLFMNRYFYVMPLKEAAQQTGMGETRAKSMLFRMRNSLKEYLKKEGYAL